MNKLTKKFIGTSKVKDGVARDWFTLPEHLDRGVYQLIGEYTGNEAYQPSRDIKKLIIGFYSEFRNMNSAFHVREGVNRVQISGKLVGYTSDDDMTPLSYRDVYFKVVPHETRNVTPLYERWLDGTTLYPLMYNTNSKTYATTDSEGTFSTTLLLPNNLNNYDYDILTYYGGDDEYVATVKQSHLYLGNSPTFCSISANPNYHISNTGTVVLSSTVYKSADMNDDGIPKTNAVPVKEGEITYYMSTDQKTWTIIKPDGETPMTPKSLEDDGIVNIRLPFSDPNFSGTVYIRAWYSGYSASTDDEESYSQVYSRVLPLKVDSDGDTVDNIRLKMSYYNSGTKIMRIIANYPYVPAMELIYDNGESVPDGSATITYET